MQENRTNIGAAKWFGGESEIARIIRFALVSLCRRITSRQHNRNGLHANALPNGEKILIIVAVRRRQHLKMDSHDSRITTN